MSIFLYQEAAGLKMPGTAANLGLWSEKFFHTWQPKAGKWEAEKGLWIKDMASRTAGDKALLEEAQGRREKLAQARGGQIATFTTEGVFFTGSGLEHPTEVGFLWHRTLGVPFLPGSSVKGLVRAYAAEWLGIEAQELQRIFGGAEKKGTQELPLELPGTVGSVAFLDVLPEGPVKLQAEIMTPHYSPYYQGQGQVVPGDWTSPTPIPFLAVAPGQAFSFAVLPLASTDAEDAEKAMQWLEKALAYLGAGAKTAAGYGRFALDLEKKKQQEQRQAQAALKAQAQKQAAEEARQKAEAEARQQAAAAEAEQAVAQEAMAAAGCPEGALWRRELAEAGYDEPTKDGASVFSQVLDAWVQRMNAAAGAERAYVAKMLAAWYEANNPGQWATPKKKHVAKVIAIKAVLEEGK